MRSLKILVLQLKILRMTDELKTVLQNLVLKQKIGGLLGITIIDNLGNDLHRFLGVILTPQQAPAIRWPI
jgi:hypothetical protein